MSSPWSMDQAISSVKSNRHSNAACSRWKLTLAFSPQPRNPMLSGHGLCHVLNISKRDLPPFEREGSYRWNHSSWFGV